MIFEARQFASLLPTVSRFRIARTILLLGSPALAHDLRQSSLDDFAA
jgi:hypothetical protein